jgi:hypothetical protein
MKNMVQQAVKVQEVRRINQGNIKEGNPKT